MVGGILKFTVWAALVALGSWAWLAFAGTASAHGSATCQGMGGIEVHGQHVIGDYVTGLGGIFGDGLSWPPNGEVGEAIGGTGGAVTPGGPGPGFHFLTEGLPPGASFCNPQAHPNGFDTPDNVPSPGNPG